MTSASQTPLSNKNGKVTAAWIRRLPKAELHLHLEGTVTPKTLVELSQGQDEPLSLVDAQALYQYSDFTGFMMAFKAVSQRLRDADDFELITYRMLQKLAAQGVLHAEVYVSVGVIFHWKNAAFEPLFEGMERGRERGERDFGVSLYWIFDAARQFGVEAASRVYQCAAALRPSYPSIVGIGVGGDERHTGAEPFKALYAEARNNGLRLTAHAGETIGPEAIWGSLNIGAERIGHALSAIDDPELVGLLAERQVPLEICITSNLRTGCCSQLMQHPVRSYFDAGLMVTINSDDPAMFESDLDDEYLLAHRAFEFTAEHLRELAANSFEASFLPPDTKLAFLKRLESLP